MDVLAIDVGGSKVKALRSGEPLDAVRKAPSGPGMGPREMVAKVRDLADGWDFDAVAIGYPGPVRDGRPLSDPRNLGSGWVDFDFEGALGRPVRVVNDAAMQALGSYEGGRMLFLGLGTGLGSALVVDGTLVSLELAHLPYRDGRTYEDVVGRRGLDELGKRRWREEVLRVVELFRDALIADYVVLGGGNVKKLDELPEGVRRGANVNAFVGGFRLWSR